MAPSAWLVKPISSVLLRVWPGTPNHYYYYSLFKSFILGTQNIIIYNKCSIQSFVICTQNSIHYDIVFMVLYFTDLLRV